MDYDKLKDARNAGGNFSAFLGMETTKIERGYAEGHLKIKNEYLNPYGIVHGGVLFSLMDTIGGSCAISLGNKVVTVDASIQYLNAAANTTDLYAYAKALKEGRRLQYVEVKICDKFNNLLCKGLLTYYNVTRY